MKKIIAVLFLVVMVLTMSSVAEEIDVDSLSLNQLIALELKIQQKIFELDSMNNSVLYPGRYEAGSDIESGEYLFQCVSLMTGRNFASIRKCDADGNEMDLELLDPDESYRMQFADGDIFELYNGVVTFLKR